MSLNKVSDIIMDEIISKRDLIRKDKVLIDVIRRYGTDDKSLIAKAANVSWPTVNNFINKNSNNGLVLFDEQKYSINPEYGIFMGIAVGARETKVTFVDMAFEALSDSTPENYNFSELFEELSIIDGLSVKKKLSYMICFTTENSLGYISHMCNEIIKTSLTFFSQQNELSLLGIGITFPGIIDKSNLKVGFCPNITCLNGVYLLNIFEDDVIDKLNKNGISLCIAHDTAAIAVFEKENLYKHQKHNKYKNKENIVCLYLGIGLGLGIIINNQLLTGNNNSIGEIGHIPGPDISYLEPPESNKVLRYDYEHYLISNENEPENRIDIKETERCHCGINNCIERLIRVNVFNSETKQQQITKMQNLDDFHSRHPYRYSVLKNYLEYLFTIIINLFNPDLIVLCGSALNSLSALKTDKYELKQSSAIFLPASNCDIINGSERPDCVAIGAAILAYYKLIESNGKNDESGMQFNVSWNKNII